VTPEQLRRTEAITAALDALAWFKIPRTVDSIIGVYAEALGEQTRHLPYGATPAGSDPDVVLLELTANTDPAPPTSSENT